MRTEVPTPVAIAIIVVAVIAAAGAILWGMRRRAGNPEEIERIIQAGVVGGGVKAPPSGATTSLGQRGGLPSAAAAPASPR